MATPLTKEEFELFSEHVKRFKNVCPVCGTQQWEVAGLEAANSISITGVSTAQVEIGVEAFPVVSIVCSRCFYVRQFAWQPIQQRLPGLFK